MTFFKLFCLSYVGWVVMTYLLLGFLLMSGKVKDAEVPMINLVLLSLITAYGLTGFFQ